MQMEHKQVHKETGKGMALRMGAAETGHFVGPRMGSCVVHPKKDDQCGQVLRWWQVFPCKDSSSEANNHGRVFEHID